MRDLASLLTVQWRGRLFLARFFFLAGTTALALTTLDWFQKKSPSRTQSLTFWLSTRTSKAVLYRPSELASKETSKEECWPYSVRKKATSDTVTEIGHLFSTIYFAFFFTFQWRGSLFLAFFFFLAGTKKNTATFS